MAALHPDKIWWTTAEIAEAELPDMPKARQAVEKMAKRLGWQPHPEFARKRSGRGGGWEYRWNLFADSARRKLLKDASVKLDTPKPRDVSEVHTWFEGLPDTVKAKALERHKTILMVLEMERTGLTRFLAVDQVARVQGVSDRTIWNWLKMVDCVDSADWLCHLAPRHRAAKRNVKKAECDPNFLDVLKGSFLRLERPTFTDSYRVAIAISKDNGWSTLPERTARRRLNEQVPRVSQILAREGNIGLARCFPPQTRDRTSMWAMNGVNADCHKIDVFVIWPDGTIDRPQIIAFQDLYSAKFLAWRVDHSPNKVAVMAAFGDMIEEYGIPEHVLFDNGSEFVNKWLTGRTPTRFSGKIRAEDPLGVLPQMGIEIHWALPAHGQSKPIERGFRDFAQSIAKDPRFAGAYVGHKPDAKPENYGSRAIPAEEFMRILAQGIDEHNARSGRRSDTAHGRSFDETFAESYATANIRKATAEQRRLWLMGQDQKTMQRGHGQIKLHKNEYWSDWMNEHAGEKVTVRFDVEDLHAGLYVYALSGEYLGFAACKIKVDFFSTLEAMQNHNRQIARHKRLQKKVLKELNPMGVREVAAQYDAVARAETPKPEAKVIGHDFGRRKASETLVKRPQFVERETDQERARHIAFLEKHRAKKISKPNEFIEEETPRERFDRAQVLADKIAAGGLAGEAEQRWLNGYQSSSPIRRGLMSCGRTKDMINPPRHIIRP